MHWRDDQDVDGDRGSGFGARGSSFRLECPVFVSFVSFAPESRVPSPEPRLDVIVLAQMSPDGGNQERVPRGPKFQTAIVRNCRLHAVDEP